MGQRGRPTAQIVLSDDERDDARAVGSAPDDGPGVGVALSDRVGGGRRGAEPGHRSGAELQRDHGRQVADPVRRQTSRRADRRAAAGSATQDHRRDRRAGDRHDAGGVPAGRFDAVVDTVDGRQGRVEPDGGLADLAHVRVEAASDRGLQAVDRPAVHRQGPRRRRARTSTRPTPRSCCVSTRRPKSKRSIGPRRCCRCCPAPQPAGPTPTSATAPPISTPRSTWPPGKVLTQMTDQHRAVEFRSVPEPDRPAPCPTSSPCT